MHIDSQRYFYLSGFITFGLTALIILSIGMRFFSISTPQSFALVKSETISISLYDSPHKNSLNDPLPVHEQVEQPATQEEKTDAPEPIVQETSKVPEITDLFSTVKPSKENKKPNEKSNILSNLNTLEEKVLSTKRESQFSEKVKTLDLAKSGVKMAAASGSTGPQVNEYHAKIQGIIYTNFHPASGTQGYAARVRIAVSAEGKITSYKVLSYSGNAVFNAEVDWLKERLRQVGFPAHPMGEDSVFEIILTAKE